MVSFTDAPCGLSEYVTRENPSALVSAFVSLRQVKTIFRGGSMSMISPLLMAWPSGFTKLHDAPGFHFDTCHVPGQ
jgi:hypothetical protein